MSTLFIADLHLSENTPQLTQLFLKLVSEQAPSAEAIYIMGDFFESWIGDDDETEFTNRIRDALQTLSQSNTKIYLFHGNRDFLIGEKFARACGAELIPEDIAIDLYGKKILLLHGDSLCWQDVSYQRFRKIVRNTTMQRLFLMLPLKLRKLLADCARGTSKRVSLELMDVHPDAVTHEFKQHNATQIIHGHTHRPGIHYHNIDGTQYRRIVLSDWHEKGNMLVVTPEKSELIYF